jgi:hypothetical protein
VGARDLYVELSSPGPQLVFIDTPTAAGGARTRLAIRNGPCPAASGPELVCTPIDECGPIPYNRVMAQLEPGRSCLVVEEADPAAISGSVQLRLLAAGRSSHLLLEPGGTLPAGSADTNTCGQPLNADASCGAPGAPSAAFAMPVCPGQGQLTVIVDPVDAGMLDAVVSLRRSLPGGSLAACQNTSPGPAPEMLVTPISGPELYWIVVTGTAPAQCGPFDFSHSRS